jgi:hypothetical protein
MGRSLKTVILSIVCCLILFTLAGFVASESNSAPTTPPPPNMTQTPTATPSMTPKPIRMPKTLTSLTPLPTPSPNSFDFKDILFAELSTLSAWVETIDRGTGDVRVNGVDTSRPSIPFTVEWGDGSTSEDFFPFDYTYSDTSKNYVITVISHYLDGSTSKTEVLAMFVSSDIRYISLPTNSEVIIPNATVTLMSRIPEYSPPSTLTIFDDSYFGIIPRSTAEYVLNVAAVIQSDFANQDIYMVDGKFKQVVLRDPGFGGMYSLWYTTPVALVAGDYAFQDTFQWSSLMHEMGHNFTLNSPANYYYGGKIDGYANSIFSESMAQIFQHATAHFLLNHYEYYGLSDDLAFDIKANARACMRTVRQGYEDYLTSGKVFCSWNDPVTPDDETFGTFMIIAYKFFEHAEANSEYGLPLQRMMALLQTFDQDWRNLYDQYHNTPEADSFRSTLMVAALSYAFETDLRQEFRDLNFPISDVLYDEIYPATPPSTPVPSSPAPTQPPSLPAPAPPLSPTLTLTPTPTLVIPHPTIYSTYTLKAPDIDGVLGPGEWQGNPLRKTLSYVSIDGAETHEMVAYFAHDDNHLYVAIMITNDDFESSTALEIAGKYLVESYDVIELYFDNDNDDVIEQGEDIHHFWNLEYDDWYYAGNGSWNKDQRKDGIGTATHSNQGIGDYVYEFKIPLDSGDAQDLSITPGSTVGIKILYREMHYDPATDIWIWGEAQDGWPAKNDRFDGATYGQLVLSEAPPPSPAPTPTTPPPTSAPTPDEKSFTGSVPLPSQLSTDPEVIGTNVGLAILTVLIFYLAATVFNSTIKENYEIIQGWLRRASKRLKFLRAPGSEMAGDRRGYKPKLRAYLEGTFVVAICALIYWFLNPYFANGLRGFALFISLALGIAAATFGYDGIQVLVTGRRFHIPAGIRIYPIAILIAIIFVILCNAIHFHPGVIYGFVGAYATLSISQRLDERQQGIAILYGTLVVLAISVATFFLRDILYNLEWRQTGFWRYLVDDILVAGNVIGLEGLVFSLALPLSFLDGAKLKAWNFWVWLVVACTVTFGFYYIFINKDGSFVEAAKNMKTFIMYALMGLSLIVSFGTWLFFKWRHKPLSR